MDCKFCKERCQKAGKQKNGTQKFYCKSCKKYQQHIYTYQAYESGIVKLVPRLVCNSVGIRGISRVLKIAVNTVVKIIKVTADAIVKPVIPLNRRSFEVDELRTYIGNKENQYWIAYGLCSDTRQVVDFVVGKRSKRTLQTIISTMLLSGVNKIKTDRLNIYEALIPAERHIAAAYIINHIERSNLNLRTHLKRLARRTICFSKNIRMLTACVKIYFWYD